VIDLRASAGEALLLEALRSRPLLALDFDGTLSPLVEQPAAAAMDPRVPPLLAPLMAKMPVAIVSGRGIVDLVARVPVKGLLLVGNHGNEWGLEEPAAPHRAASLPLAAGAPLAAAERRAWQQQVCLDWAAALAAPLAELGDGIAFEAKSVSLSIHYRLMPDPEQARRQVVKMLGELRPAPEIIEGKFVLNLMAPGLVTKFEAIQELADRHDVGTVIFVGDDVTDERVFERAPAHWLTVRVWDDEAGAASQTSAARTFVHRVDGVVELLERLGGLARNL